MSIVPDSEGHAVVLAPANWIKHTCTSSREHIVRREIRLGRTRRRGPMVVVDVARTHKSNVISELPSGALPYCRQRRVIRDRERAERVS